MVPKAILNNGWGKLHTVWDKWGQRVLYCKSIAEVNGEIKFLTKDVKHTSTSV